MNGSEPSGERSGLLYVAAFPSPIEANIARAEAKSEEETIVTANENSDCLNNVACRQN